MRPELEEIQYIEDYLLNKLSKEKKEEFELQLSIDPEFAHKVEMQQIVTQRIKHLSVKQSVALAHHKFMRKHNFPFNLGGSRIFLNSLLSISVVTIIVYLVMNISNYIEVSKNSPPACAIDPTINSIGALFTIQSLNADSGAVLYFESGSIIRIPPGSFTDLNGELVKGSVEVKIREFRNAKEISESGIPLNYGLAKDSIHLKSSTMFEIYAFKDKIPLMIKKGKKIEIIQTTYLAGRTFGIYYFDQKNRIWVEKGKDSTSIYEINKETQLASTVFLTEPLKPKRAGGAIYTFSLKANPVAYPELKPYQNVKFEVLDEDTIYNSNYIGTLWEDVQLKKGIKKGTYKAVLSNASETITILARPVFKGKDYEKAMIEYNKELAKYKHYKEQSEELKSKNMIRIDSLGQKIYSKQKNAVVAELNRKRKIILATGISNELKNIIYIEPTDEELLKNREIIEQAYKKVKKKNQITRAYLMDNFGLWNCD